MTYQIKAPMVNVNEDEIELVEWHKQKDQFVSNGELLATFESTKSTYDFSAPESGYFTPLVESGTLVTVGQIIGYFSTEKGMPMEETPQETLQVNKEGSQKSWTRKAQLLAERNLLDLGQVAESTTEARITEQIVIEFMQQRNQPSLIHGQMKLHGIERVLILGGGNVAALVIDILTRVPTQTAVGILDDDAKLHNTAVLGIPVLGGFDRIFELAEQKVFDTAALAVGILPARRTIFEDLTSRGIVFTNIIDPTAVIGVNARIGAGNMIMAFCRLGPEATIGDNNFLSAYVNIEHHNIMGSHCTFGPNVMMSGGVQIGNAVKFGTGIAVEPRLSIGDHAVIASGVTVTTNVPANTVVKARTNFTL